jgi:LacI family transcriptional regulator
MCHSQFQQVKSKVGKLVGNHRYRRRETSENGFRSYFCEYAPAFTLLESFSTFETSAVARKITEKPLMEHRDLKNGTP